MYKHKENQRQAIKSIERIKKSSESLAEELSAQSRFSVSGIELKTNSFLATLTNKELNRARKLIKADQDPKAIIQSIASTRACALSELLRHGASDQSRRQKWLRNLIKHADLRLQNLKRHVCSTAKNRNFSDVQAERKTPARAQVLAHVRLPVISDLSHTHRAPRTAKANDKNYSLPERRQLEQLGWRERSDGEWEKVPFVIPKDPWQRNESTGDWELAEEALSHTDFARQIDDPANRIELDLHLANWVRENFAVRPEIASLSKGVDSMVARLRTSFPQYSDIMVSTAPKPSGRSNDDNPPDTAVWEISTIRTKTAAPEAENVRVRQIANAVKIQFEDFDRRRRDEQFKIDMMEYKVQQTEFDLHMLELQKKQGSEEFEKKQLELVKLRTQHQSLKADRPEQNTALHSKAKEISMLIDEYQNLDMEVGIFQSPWMSPSGRYRDYTNKVNDCFKKFGYQSSAAKKELGIIPKKKRMQEINCELKQLLEAFEKSYTMTALRQKNRENTGIKAAEQIAAKMQNEGIKPLDQDLYQRIKAIGGFEKAEKQEVVQIGRITAAINPKSKDYGNFVLSLTDDLGIPYVVHKQQGLDGMEAAVVEKGLSWQS